LGDEAYVKLRELLDGMPGGFPATESGVEMKILKKLFAPEDAEIALGLTRLPESPAMIARNLASATARNDAMRVCHNCLLAYGIIYYYNKQL